MLYDELRRSIKDHDNNDDYESYACVYVSIISPIVKKISEETGDEKNTIYTMHATVAMWDFRVLNTQ